MNLAKERSKARKVNGISVEGKHDDDGNKNETTRKEHIKIE